MPRPVRRKPGRSARLWLPRLFILPAWGSNIRENTEGWSLWMLALFALFWNGIVLRKEEDTGGDSTTWHVVVVYDRFRPRRNVVYAWSGYELA